MNLKRRVLRGIDYRLILNISLFLERSNEKKSGKEEEMM